MTYEYMLWLNFTIIILVTWAFTFCPFKATPIYAVPHFYGKRYVKIDSFFFSVNFPIQIKETVIHEALQFTFTLNTFLLPMFFHLVHDA